MAAENSVVIYVPDRTTARFIVRVPATATDAELNRARTAMTAMLRSWINNESAYIICPAGWEIESFTRLEPDDDPIGDETV